MCCKNNQTTSCMIEEGFYQWSWQVMQEGDMQGHSCNMMNGHQRGVWELKGRGKVSLRQSCLQITETGGARETEDQHPSCHHTCSLPETKDQPHCIPKAFEFEHSRGSLCANYAAQHALNLPKCFCQILQILRKGRQVSPDLAGPDIEIILSVQLGRASSILIRAPVSLRTCETISPPCA